MFESSNMASAILASKCTRTHAQIIDSVLSDNPSAEKKNNKTAVKCNHFSIRGYVAEVRERDPTLGNPFSSYNMSNDSTKTSHELPPMVVPKFRWWRCDGCVPGAGISTRTYKEAQKHSADKADDPEASTSSDSNGNRNYTPLNVGADPKGKGKAHVEDELAPHSGCEKGFLKDSTSKGILQRTTEGILASRSTENGMVESHHHDKNCKSDGTEMGPCEEDVNFKAANVDETRQGKPRSSSEGKSEDSWGIHGAIKAGCRVVPLPDLNECDVETLDDENHHDVFVTGSNNNNLCEDQDDDDYYLLTDRRKTPKVRLMSELLSLKRHHFDAKVSDDSQGRKRVSESVEIISEYDSEDEYVEIIPDALAKRCRKSALDRSPLPEKKKKKKKHKKFKTEQTNRVVDLPLKSDVSARLTEKNSAVTKKKGKMLQAFLGKDDRAMNDATQNVHNDPSQEDGSSAKMGQIRVDPIKDGFYLPFLGVESSVLDGGIGRKYNESRNVGETSKACDGNCERSNFFEKNSKGKQVMVPEIEEEGPLLQQTTTKVYNSFMNQKEQTSEVSRRRVHDIDINSIPTDDKAPEQGQGDDIPMDIVELMAKNQYERHLSDPKDKLYPSLAPGIFGNNNVNSNGNPGPYSEPMPKFGQTHFLTTRKPPPVDARHNMVHGFDNVGSFDPNHLSRFVAPAGQGQGHFSSYSSHINSFRASSPRPNTINRVWPTFSMARPMPALGISNPLINGKIHHQGPSVLNFSNGVNFGECNISFSNAYNSGVSESSADLYSNEAIPAMHLLSLMQNAAKMRSSVPFNSPPIHHDHRYNNKQHSSSRKWGPQETGGTSSRQLLVENNGRSSSFQYYDTGIGGNVGSFISPIPLTSRGQRNVESCSHFAVSGGDHRPQTPVSRDLVRKGKSGYVLNRANGHDQRMLDSRVSMKDAPNYVHRPQTRPDQTTIGCTVSGKEICTVNRNPSEFNDLRELSRYTIRPHDPRRKLMGRDRSARPRGHAKRLEIRMNRPVLAVKEQPNWPRKS